MTVSGIHMHEINHQIDVKWLGFYDSIPLQWCELGGKVFLLLGSNKKNSIQSPGLEEDFYYNRHSISRFYEVKTTLRRGEGREVSVSLTTTY